MAYEEQTCLARGGFRKKNVSVRQTEWSAILFFCWWPLTSTSGHENNAEREAEKMQKVIIRYSLSVCLAVTTLPTVSWYSTVTENDWRRRIVELGRSEQKVCDGKASHPMSVSELGRNFFHTFILLITRQVPTRRQWMDADGRPHLGFFPVFYFISTRHMNPLNVKPIRQSKLSRMPLDIVRRFKGHWTINRFLFWTLYK